MHKLWHSVVLLVVCSVAIVAAAHAGETPDKTDEQTPLPQAYALPEDYKPIETHPKPGEGIQKYAEDAQSGAQANFGVQPIHDNEIFATLLVDRLEFQSREWTGAFVWDATGWVGTDYNKLYLESEGTILPNQLHVDEAMLELYYGRAVTKFWDIRAGVRWDVEPKPERVYAALGILGLAPYWFEVEANAYLSDQGNVTARLEVEYDIQITQRWILQPRFETNVAFQDVRKYNIGAGFNDFELGVRLRFEEARQYAPYIGLSWNRKLGETAKLANFDGEDISQLSVVLGLRLWFF
ncbi:copper resistance protein B [Oceanidesulfovibrio marinus]|nr:copper resistance protein B [Oceanidesulfovibrio marinus]